MKEKQQKHRVLFITAPLICLTLGLLLTISHRGMPLEERPPRLAPLQGGAMAGAEKETEEAAGPEKDALSEGTQAQNVQTRDAEVLLLAEADSPLLEVVTDSLDSMKLSWRISDTWDEEELCGAETVLLCEPNLPSLEGEGIVSLFDWIEDGGRLGIMTIPAADGYLRIASHKLGMEEYSSEYTAYHSFRAEEGVLPVFGDLLMDEELEDYLLPVRLTEDCEVMLYTGDEKKMPLMWSRDIGEGRIVVCNHTLISGKDSRGYIPMTLQALEDVLVYPVINAGMVFIDDFPAPQPEGFDDQLREQYGLSTQGFFRNHWWPDMKMLARRYSLRYTGVLVETYNRVMKPPFLPDQEDNSLIRYYASELLQSGGEMGLHGYNHQPLCPNGWPYKDEDYLTWDSEKDMSAAVEELVRYGHSFLPDAEFTSYVPPSNYLSEEGKAVLVKTVPTLLAVSGVYLPEEGIAALVQEFREEADGTVSVPRVTSGFSLDSYIKMMTGAELNLHGVFSHFIHPDDVLDSERGALLGWEQMRTDFEYALTEITKAYPALRWCTASEAAAAVQRFERVQVKRIREGDTLTLQLSPFYDEVWLCLCSQEPLLSVEGGEVFPAGDNLWLRADSEQVKLTFQAG